MQTQRSNEDQELEEMASLRQGGLRWNDDEEQIFE